MTISFDEETKMTTQKLLAMLMFAAAVLPLQAQADGSIEPTAGNWRTWVISSGRDYRWIDLLNARSLAGAPTATNGRTGVYTYVALAMHDATIATWESKYAYN